jgi:ribosomal protein L30E
MRCHWPIASLPGVDEKLQQDLAALGITDTQWLLKVSEAKHVALAAELEQPLRQLKKIMALASLAQVPAANTVACCSMGALLRSNSSVAPDPN